MYSNIGRLLWNEFWEVLGRSPSGALLGQHDDLSARLVLLHAAMGLSDLVEVEGFADQFKHFVDSLRTDFLDLFGDRAGIDKHLVDAAGPQQFFAFRVASRRGDEGAVAFSDGRGRQTNRGGATADQQTLAFFETKRLEQ